MQEIEKESEKDRKRENIKKREYKRANNKCTQSRNDELILFNLGGVESGKCCYKHEDVRRPVNTIS